jgi:hypothetical protein
MVLKKINQYDLPSNKKFKAFSVCERAKHPTPYTLHPTFYAKRYDRPADASDHQLGYF